MASIYSDIRKAFILLKHVHMFPALIEDNGAMSFSILGIDVGMSITNRRFL